MIKLLTLCTHCTCNPTSMEASRAGCQGCKLLHEDVTDFSDWRVASPYGKTSAQDVLQQVIAASYRCMAQT